MVLEQRPSLVLLDIILPGLSGLDVCREIRRNPELDAMPIIMLTAMGEDSDVVLGLELGANDYIPKPFSPRVLLARIRTALRHKADTLAAPPYMQSSDRATVSAYGIRIEPVRHRAAIGRHSPQPFAIRVCNSPSPDCQPRMVIQQGTDYFHCQRRRLPGYRPFGGCAYFKPP